jgi:PAS domain S-box-containing protein
MGDDSDDDLGDYDDGDFGDDDDDTQIVGDGDEDGSKGGKIARRKRMRERQDQVDMRRERNRILARKTRLRKKLFFESLQHQAQQLASENEMLKDIVKNRIDSKIRALILPETGNDASGGSGSRSGGADGGITDGGSSAGGGASFSLPTAAHSFPAPKHEMPSSAHSSSMIGAGGIKGGGGVKVLGREDFSLISSIQAAQRSFVITDPSLPDNPIIFASQGFLDLSGYSLEEVLGRNCRFMQVANTDQSQVQLLRDGIQRGEDVSVCLLNARADGTEFYNQIFVAALRDANNNIANYVGVQVEVRPPSLTNPKLFFPLGSKPQKYSPLPATTTSIHQVKPTQPLSSSAEELTAADEYSPRGSRAKSGLFGKKRALDSKPQSSGAEGRGERLARRNSAQDLLKANAHHAVDPNAPSQVSAAALARSRAAAADDAHPLEI